MEQDNPIHPFRRLLRDKQTSRWLDAEGHLVPDLDKAKDFNSLGELMKFCQTLEFSDLEIVLKHPQDEYDLVLECPRQKLQRQQHLRAL